MIRMQMRVQRGSYKPERLIKSLRGLSGLEKILYLIDQIPLGIPVPGNECPASYLLLYQ